LGMRAPAGLPDPGTRSGHANIRMMRWTPPADGIEVPAWKWCATTTKAGDVRMQITTVGLDIAKNLFQVHGADAQGRVLLKRKLARGKVDFPLGSGTPALCVDCKGEHWRWGWQAEPPRTEHEQALSYAGL